MLSENIDQVLRDYFQWAEIQSPDNIGYPHCIPTERLRRSVLSSEKLSDDEALWINGALSYLALDNPEAYAVVLNLYRDNKSIRWLADRGAGDRRTLMRLASEGREFVRGVLCGVLMAG